MQPFLPGLVSAWMSDSPSSPRLTWYGGASSRIELSGHVLATWVLKTTQALDDLAGAGTGTRVLLDLPAHWRTATWALGTWTAGACVVLPAGDGSGGSVDGAPVDVVVTDHPQRHEAFATDGGVVLAQAMDDLALRWQGEPLRPGIVDAAAEVMTYPDQVASLPVPDVSDPALVTADDAVPFAALPTWASGRNQSRLLATTHGSGGHPSRVLASTASLQGLLSTALAVFGNGGSLVVVAPHLHDDARRRIAEQEGITETW